MPALGWKPKVNSSPSPSLLRKVLGGPISESVQTEWPELAKEWASAEVNMPEETAKVSRVSSMGPIERLWTGATGRTAFGNVSVNRPAVEEDKNLRGVLQHELTHVGQKPRGLIGYLKSMGTSWENRPEEQEAMAAESKFPRIQRDIYLPSEYDKKKKR